MKPIGKINTAHLPPWLKWSLRLVIGFVLLTVALWLGMAAYISTHNKYFLKEISDQLNEHINGKLQIAALEPTLIRGFPGIGFALKNVVLHDSLYAQHKHELLNAQNIYVSVNVFSMLSGKPRIREISIADGSIYLYTDSTGYTNTNLFAKRTESGKKKGTPRINSLYFEQVHFVYENSMKAKMFRFNIKKIGVSVVYDGNGWVAKTGIEMLVEELAFNTAKGSYMKGKQLTANLTLNYDRIKEELNIPQQKIKIENDILKIGGIFYVKKSPVPFLLNIATDGIDYKRGLALVSPAVAAKVSMIDLSAPVAISVDINGRMLYRDTPIVKMAFHTTGNTLTMPGGEITDCSFAGTFDNALDTALGHNNENSAVTLTDLKGKWQGIPFSSAKIALTNLSRPVLSGRFLADFNVQQLGDIIGDDNFLFKSGTVGIDLLYKGGVYNNDTTPSYILGSIKIADAAVTYLPRNLAVNHSNLTMRFAGNDLYVEHVKLQTGSNILEMEGYLKNFGSLYYSNPEKILLDWKIKSKELNLADFIAFLPKRKAAVVATAAKKTNKVSNISRQLDRMLDMGNVHMSLSVDKAVYQRFTATNIAADVSLTDSGITIRNTTVSNAGGKLLINANIDQRGTVNRFALNANIAHVNVQDFFYQCGNFGQSAITDSNIKGTLDATADVSGNITDNGKMVPHSLDGMVDFKLNDAAIINFQPFIKIGKYVFRNRDMRNVTISNMTNKIYLKGDKITISPMHIESSALTLNIGGIYSLGKGTDINIDIPLRNPKKDELILDDSIRAEHSEKGIVVHLKATDGSDGNVQIKWLMLGKNSGDGDKKAERKQKRKDRKSK